MLRIALPSTLLRVMSFGCIVIAQAFIGHNSEMGLAVYALLRSTFIPFIYAVMVMKYKHSYLELYRIPGIPGTWTARRMKEQEEMKKTRPDRCVSSSRTMGVLDGSLGRQMRESSVCVTEEEDDLSVTN